MEQTKKEVKEVFELIEKLLLQESSKRKFKRYSEGISLDFSKKDIVLMTTTIPHNNHYIYLNDILENYKEETPEYQAAKIGLDYKTMESDIKYDSLGITFIETFYFTYILKNTKL